MPGVLPEETVINGNRAVGQPRCCCQHCCQGGRPQPTPSHQYETAAEVASLKETCSDEAAAAATLGRLLDEADGGRFPNRAATLGQALAAAVAQAAGGGAGRQAWPRCLVLA